MNTGERAAPAAASFASTRWSAISAVRSTQRPLTLDAHHAQFGTVSDRFHSQALSRLSWLSYSPPDFPSLRDVHPVAEERSGPPVSPLSRLKVPHASQVERALTGLAPETHCGSIPLGGIPTAHTVATRFNACGRRAFARRSVSVAPRRGAHHRIEVGNCSARNAPSLVWRNLLPTASVEHGQAPLDASGSTSQPICGW